MSKINYTKEMQEQDLLWLTREENLSKMKELMIQISNSSVYNKIDKVFCTVDYTGTIDTPEVVTYIFDNDTECDDFLNTWNTEKDGYGNCKQLIKAIMDITLENVSKGGGK